MDGGGGGGGGGVGGGGGRCVKRVSWVMDWGADRSAHGGPSREGGGGSGKSGGRGGRRRQSS